MPLGPRVLLTRSPTAMAPMKEDYHKNLLERDPFHISHHLPNGHFQLFLRLLDPGKYLQELKTIAQY